MLNQSKRTCFNKLVEFIQNADIFGQSVTLNINKSKSFNTIFGGVSSIFIMGILIAFFQSNISAFFSKSEVIFSTETQFQPNSDNIVMNIRNYMVAFSIEQNDYLKNPYFNITVEQKQYFRDSNGDLTKKTQQIQLEPCTLEHFTLLLSEPGINFTTQYSELNIGNWLCPKKNFQFNLAGTYTSQKFEYIRIIVKDCKEEEGYDKWKPTCATQQERDAHLADQGQFKFQIYQVNSVVNPRTSQQYIQTYFDGEMYFTFVPKKLYRQANLFYRKYKFQNDQSLFPFQQIEDKEILVRRSDDYRDLTELGRDTDNNYAIIYMRRSQFTEYVTRRFTKIDELLSFLGGFLQIMMAGFGIIIIYYNKLSMLVSLSNQLYTFPKDQIKLNQTFDVSMLNDSKSNIQNQISGLKSVEQEIDLILQSAVNKYLESNQIAFSLKILLNHLSFGLLFNDRNAQIIQRAIEQIDYDLDITNILYQIQEINKLKIVLFQREQHILFNFTPKPIIQLEIDEQFPSRMSLNMKINARNNEDTEQKNKKIISNLYDVWKQIKKDEAKNSHEKDINLKLRKELGSEIEQFFFEIDKINEIEIESVLPTRNINRKQEILQTIMIDSIN